MVRLMYIKWAMPENSEEKDKLRQSPIILVFRLIFLVLAADILYVVISLVGGILIGSLVPPPFNILTATAVIMILMVLAQILLAIYISLSWYYYYYNITENGVVTRYGVLFKKRDNNIINGIDDITFQQSFWGQIFNYGDVIIREPKTEAKIVIAGIPDPQGLTKNLEQKFKSKMTIPS